jgi:hypothetical protein
MLLGMVFKKLQKKVISGLAVLAILLNTLSPTLAWALGVNDVKNLQNGIVWLPESSTEANFEAISALPEFDQWVEVCTTQNNQWWAVNQKGEVIAKSKQRPAHVPPHLFQHTCEYCSHTVQVLTAPCPLFTGLVLLLQATPVVWPDNAFTLTHQNFNWSDQAARAPPKA